jgi:hypothetical protein
MNSTKPTASDVLALMGDRRPVTERDYNVLARLQDTYYRAQAAGLDGWVAAEHLATEIARDWI